MLSLSSAFVASIVTWIPGAAPSHSGLADASKGGTYDRVSASRAIGLASRPQRDSAGLNTQWDAVSPFPVGNPRMIFGQPAVCVRDQMPMISAVTKNYSPSSNQTRGNLDLRRMMVSRE